VIADGIAHQLDDRLEAEFAHQHGAVRLDRFETDAELLPDVLLRWPSATNCKISRSRGVSGRSDAEPLSVGRPERRKPSTRVSDTWALK